MIASRHRLPNAKAICFSSMVTIGVLVFATQGHANYFPYWYPAAGPSLVTVVVECRGMRDGTLQNCHALDSMPKNEVAQRLASEIASHMKGRPPGNWPSGGREVRLSVTVAQPHRVGPTSTPM